MTTPQELPSASLVEETVGEAMSEAKYCTGCKYHRQIVSYGNDWCHHPGALFGGLVSPRKSPSSCSRMRDSEKHCGADAKWFEAYIPKPRKPWWNKLTLKRGGK